MKKFLYACLSLGFCCLLLRPVWAEDPPKDLEPIPDPDANAPAVTPPSNPDDEPEVTIRKRGTDKIEEYRRHGRLYMIKVTPRIGAPYYLIDPNGDGHFVRREGFDKGLVVPNWVIKSW